MNKRIILAVSFLFFFAQYIFIPFQVSYLTELGASAAFVRIVTGAYGGAQLLLRLPVGVGKQVLDCADLFLDLGERTDGKCDLSVLLAITSTNAKGKISKIVSFFDQVR